MSLPSFGSLAGNFKTSSNKLTVSENENKEQRSEIRCSFPPFSKIRRYYWNNLSLTAYEPIVLNEWPELLFQEVSISNLHSYWIS
jgi:hypothetical protein